MNKVYLSKTKYCKAIQCNKIIWLDKNKPEEATPIDNEAVFETGKKVGELARNYFGEFVNIEFDKTRVAEMIEETKRHLQKAPNIITEASFCYKNNFCSVDILKNDIDGFEIYEVKSSTHINDIYLDDISYQVYILQNLGYKIKSANIMYINKEYIRNGELDLKCLFNVQDVTDIAFSRQEEIKNKIYEIENYMQNEDEQEQEIGMHCFKPYECPYWNYCTQSLPEKNVFSISRMRKTKMLELYNKGSYKFEDLINEDINDNYMQQIESELKDEIMIKTDEIKEFIKTLYYPLYFLDFEAFQPAIPQFDGTRPYEQIPFQYSIHYIENENSEIRHKEFLAPTGVDTRRILAEKLVKDIPSDACVITYNMSFEKSIIEKLASQFEDLRESLQKINENIKDLMIPFQKRWYYNKEMEGSYSIKYVLPALFPNEPQFDYHNLVVAHNGREASMIFENLFQKSKEEQEEVKKGLLEYCKLDTLAMVKIWEKLKEI